MSPAARAFRGLGNQGADAKKMFRWVLASSKPGPPGAQQWLQLRAALPASCGASLGSPDNRAALPTPPGSRSFHSALWAPWRPADDPDLAGLRVGVKTTEMQCGAQLGSCASAVAVQGVALALAAGLHCPC